MKLKIDNNGNVIQAGRKILTDNLTLTDENNTTVTIPENAVAVRIYSDDTFELKSGTTPIKTADDEFGCAEQNNFEVKGLTSQVIYLRWVLL